MRELRQEMKKTQHKQNTTMNLNYFLGSQDESNTKTLKKKMEAGSRLSLEIFQNRSLINSK